MILILFLEWLQSKFQSCSLENTTLKNKKCFVFSINTVTHNGSLQPESYYVIHDRAQDLHNVSCTSACGSALKRLKTHIQTSIQSVPCSIFITVKLETGIVEIIHWSKALELDNFLSINDSETKKLALQGVKI